MKPHLFMNAVGLLLHWSDMRSYFLCFFLFNFAGYFAQQMETEGICEVAEDLLDFDCNVKVKISRRT